MRSKSREAPPSTASINSQRLCWVNPPNAIALKTKKTTWACKATRSLHPQVSLMILQLSMTLLASGRNRLFRAIANKVDASNVTVSVLKPNVNVHRSAFAATVRIMKAIRWEKNSLLNIDRKNNWLKHKILVSLAAAQNLDAAKDTVSAFKRI